MVKRIDETVGIQRFAPRRKTASGLNLTNYMPQNGTYLSDDGCRKSNSSEYVKTGFAIDKDIMQAL